MTSNQTIDMETSLNRSNQHSMTLGKIGPQFWESVQYFLGFIGMFLMPHVYAFLAIGILVFVDMFTALIAAIYTKQKITSDRLKRSVVKLLVYLLLTMASIVAERMMTDKIPFIEVALGLIATTEILSIYENARKALGMSLKEWTMKQLSSKGDYFGKRRNRR